MAIDFKGFRFPESVILYAVFFYVRYAPQIADQAQKRKHPTLHSCRVDGSTRDCPVARCAR